MREPHKLLLKRCVVREEVKEKEGRPLIAISTFDNEEGR
jgi:hypothetical protein